MTQEMLLARNFDMLSHSHANLLVHDVLHGTVLLLAQWIQWSLIGGKRFSESLNQVSQMIP